MSLENYLVRSGATYEEIRSDFSPEEIEQLYKQLTAIGYPEYRGIVQEHLADIVKYIALSPSRREKKWGKQPHALLLRCAALQISSATERLLFDIRGIASIVDSGSYRSFHAEVAQWLAPILLEDVFLQFPFEGYDNPFSDNVCKDK